MRFYKTFGFLFLATSVISTGALADPYYVSGALGMSMPRDGDVSGSINDSIEYDNGVAAAIALGYRIDPAWRTEFEISHYGNDADRVNAGVSSGETTATAYMVNALYDINSGENGAWTPYIGAGLGFLTADIDVNSVGGTAIHDDDTALAGQAIVGVNYALSDTLDMFAQYKYTRAGEAGVRTAAGGNADVDYENNSVMIGVRYAFGDTTDNALATTTMRKRGDRVAGHTLVLDEPKTYRVFFNFDSATLSAEAVNTLAQVATDIGRQNITYVELVGNADTSGPADYNDALSLRRAQTVKKELIQRGVNVNYIQVLGEGEHSLLIKTPDGVKEPKNRRVDINIQ